MDVFTGKSATVRELENGMWEGYVDKQDTTDIVAYHCSEKGREDNYIDSWEFFAKLTTNKSKFSIIAFYLFWLFIITFAINLVSSTFCKFILKW